MNIVHRVQGSDGRVHRVEAPEDADPDYVVSIVEDQLSKPQPEKPGAWDALAYGAESALSSVGAAWDTLTNDLAGVEQAAAKPAPQTEAQQAFRADFEDQPEGGWWDEAKNLAKAVYDNPEGAWHEVVAQLPNSAAPLGGMAAGAAMGSALGPVGAVVGAIGGMFLGNTAIETGAIAKQYAGDGFTPEERGQTLAEGPIKGGVITAIDTATLGLNRWMAGAPGRAASGAVTKFLTDKGVDVADTVATRAALANKEVFDAAMKTGMDAARAVSTVPAKATGFALESVSEAMGEYLGEAAAGRDPSVRDALLEGMLSIPQSTAELIISNVAAEDVGTAIDKVIKGASPEATPEDVKSEINKTLLGLPNVPFTPVVFPDGSVATTPEEAANYQAKLDSEQLDPASLQETETTISPRQQADEQRIREEAETVLGAEPQRDAFPLELVNALEQATDPELAAIEEQVQDNPQYAPIAQEIKNIRAKREAEPARAAPVPPIVPREQLSLAEQITTTEATEQQAQRDKEAANLRKYRQRQRDTEKDAAYEEEFAALEAEEALEAGTQAQQEQLAEAPTTQDIEAQIKEATPKARVPKQLTLPTVEKRADKLPAAPEQQVAPEPLSSAMLDEMGVINKPTAPVRKNTVGKDMNNPADWGAIKLNLLNHAKSTAKDPDTKQRIVTPETKANILQFVADRDSQLEMFGLKGGIAAPTKPAKAKAAPDVQPSEQPVAGGTGVSPESGALDTTGGQGVVTKQPVTPSPAKPERGSMGVSATNESTAGAGKAEQPGALKEQPTAEEVATEVKKAKGKQKVYGPEEVAEAKKKAAPTKTEKRKQYKAEKVKQAEAEGLPTKMFEPSYEYKNESQDDPSTDFDYLQLRQLNKAKPFREKSKGMTDEQAAKLYFDRHTRPIDAIIDLAYDAAYDIKTFTQKKTDEPITQAEVNFLKHRGGDTIWRAINWIDQNLSKTLKNELLERYEQRLEEAAVITGIDAWRDYELAAAEAKAKGEEAPKAPDMPVASYTAISIKNRAKLSNEVFKAMSDLYEQPKAETTENVKLTKKEEAELNARIEAKIRAQEQPTRKEEQQQEAYEAALREINKHLSKDAIDASAIPIPPMAHAALNSGELGLAVTIVANTSPNPVVRRIASGLAKNIGETTVETVKNLKSESGKPVAGLFDPRTNTIKIDADASVSSHVLLHEAMHAVTSHILAKKSHPLTKKLTKLYNEVKGDLSSYYGSQSLDEFVAEAMGNPTFQQELASLYAGRDSNTPAWRQFMTAVINALKQMVGMKVANTGRYAQLNDTLEALMSPAPNTRGAGEMFLMSQADQMDTLVKEHEQGLKESLQIQPRMDQKTFKNLLKHVFSQKIPSAGKQATLGFMQSVTLADASAAIGIEGGMKMHKLFLLFDGAVDNVNENLDSAQKSLRDWRKQATPIQVQLFDELVSRSTLAEVDPSLTENQAKKKYFGDKLQEWKDMQKAWGAIQPEGQKEYNRLRNQYRILFENLKYVVNAAIKDISANDKELANRLKNDVFANIMEKATVDPYFPLWRQGDYWLRYDAKFEGSTEPVYELYETREARDAAKRELVAMNETAGKGKEEISDIEVWEGHDIQNFEKAPPTSFVRSSLKLLSEMNVDEKTREDFTRLFISSLPETSFAKSFQRRKNRLGFETNALEGFRKTAYDINRRTQKFKYSRDIRNQLDVIQENIKAYKKANSLSEGKFGDWRAQQKRDNADVIGQEWEMRANFALHPDSDWKATLARTANRFAFTGTIGFSPASALINVSQLPMVVYPYLSGKTDPKTAYKAMSAAGRFFAFAGFEHEVEIIGEKGETVKHKSFAPSGDNYYIRDSETGEYRIRDNIEIDDNPKNVFYNGYKKMTKREFVEKMMPMVKFLSDHAQLSRSPYYDTLGLELSGKKKNTLDRLTALSAWQFHITERNNRQITMFASYMNELERLHKNPIKTNDPATNEVGLSEAQKEERAIEIAFHEAQYTNGGAVLATAPRFAQKNIGRVAMMFKSFGIMMYTLQSKLLANALKGATKEQRHMARKQLAYIQGAVALMSGVQGLTLYGIYAGIHNLFKDDDEEDFETITRKALGEGIYKGGINQLSRVLGGEGVDVAARIGLSNLIIGTNRYDFDPSVEKSIVKTLGGPFYGYTSQIGRGLGDMKDGEVQRGVENILPAAFRNAFKAAYRYPREGIQTRRGDPIMGELDGGLLAAQAFGFAPAEYTRNQERAQSLKGIDRPTNENRTKLLKKLYIAYRNTDGSAIDDAIEEIRKFNEKWPNHRITASSVRSSMKKHRETSQKMYNGVLFSPNMDAYLRDLGDDWDQGFQLF